MAKASSLLNEAFASVSDRWYLVIPTSTDADEEIVVVIRLVIGVALSVLQLCLLLPG
jgi:hypothetical protein